MILIGQYDSPFVRRVAVAMALYDLPYEHQPWSVFGDPEKIAEHNPLMRVPTLVLAGGESIIESHAILDYLDGHVGADRALIAPAGEARRKAMRVMNLATGTAEKAVSLVYERAMHIAESEVWVTRCRNQIAQSMDALEADRAALWTDWWHGERPGHPDIAVACVLHFLHAAHPHLVDAARWPALAAHAARCEEMPVFADRTQKFYIAGPRA